MALRQLGNKVMDASGKQLDTGSSDGDAVRAMTERGKGMDAGGKSTAALPPSARLTIAFDFEGADVFVTKVDPAAVMAEDAAAEANPALVAGLLKRSEDEVVAKVHREEVRAKVPGHLFGHDGSPFSAEAWVVLSDGGKVAAFEPDQFAAGFVLAEPKKTKAHRRDA